jgi:alpha/beta superfamily hydrolase
MTTTLFFTGTILAVLLLLYLPQRNFVFSPTYYPNRAWFAERPNTFQLCPINGTRVRIECLIYEPDHPEQTIIYFGGKQQDSVGLLQKISMEYPDVRWVAYNYQGYGKSHGRATEHNVLSDSLHIYDCIQKRYGSVCLVGFSLGSSVASYVASKRYPQHVVLIAPFDSVPSLIQARAFFVPKKFIRYKFPTVKFVRDIHCPVYTFYSNSDEVVAPAHVKRLYANIPHPAVIKMFSGYSHDQILFCPEIKPELNSIFHTC